MEKYRVHWFGFALAALVIAAGLLGCQQRPAVPTVAVVPTEPVVVVVVTATTQPTLAPTNTAEPTITPLPTMTAAVTTTVVSTPTVQAKATEVPTEAQAAPTTADTQPQATAEPTGAPVPTNFQAPTGISPEGIAFREGDTLKLLFTSAGPLAADQCYRVDVTLGNPTGPGGVGDYFVGLCGDQTPVGGNVQFNIKPGRFRDEPNYGTLLVSADTMIPATPEYLMKWYASVVKMVNAADPVHPQVEQLSPYGIPLENSFFR